MRYLMKQATILLSFTFLLPSVHLSVKNVHLLLPTSAERGQMMNWRLGETFNLLLNWILLMYFWKNNRAQEFWAFSAPAPEPNFDPAGMTAPAPSPVHNFLNEFFEIVLSSTGLHWLYIMIVSSHDLIKRVSHGS